MIEETEEQHTTQGDLLIAEFYDVDFNILNNRYLLEKISKKAVEKSRCNVLKVYSHKFEPQGVSVLCFLEESHLAIHTYPEHNYCCLVIYTCGQTAKPKKAFQVFQKLFKTKNIKLKERKLGRKDL
jgi:S-adenosylmethionine decarboxylase proenzyme